jgi:hypothetical protein
MSLRVFVASLAVASLAVGSLAFTSLDEENTVRRAG